jgi:hypothetical protein
MPKWDQLRPLPDHVLAPLLRALISIPRPAGAAGRMRRGAESAQAPRPRANAGPV